jgi:hypothetical protein
MLIAERIKCGQITVAGKRIMFYAEVEVTVCAAAAYGMSVPVATAVGALARPPSEK